MRDRCQIRTPEGYAKLQAFEDFAKRGKILRAHRQIRSRTTPK
jgi:hypothetical protein